MLADSKKKNGNIRHDSLDHRRAVFRTWEGKIVHYKNH